MRRLAAVALIVLAACHGGGDDRAAVARVAASRQQALATGNIGLYLTLISRNYHDNGKTYTDKARELADTIVNGDRFLYQGTVTEVSVSGDHATARGRYTMRVLIKGEPFELQGVETIRLQREASEWRIVGGL